MSAFPSALDILNALARTRTGAATRNIGYGSNSRQVLDVYHAAGSASLSPVIVFFYGGSWEEGERSDYMFVGTSLAARGITTVVADYRVFPEVRFPTFVEDGARVLRWTAENIAGMQGDAKRIVVMGHSAGAHIAAMLALDDRWLADAGVKHENQPCGFVGLAGPYDFLPLHSATLKQIFGPEDQLASTQPINFVTGKAPPCLLASGRDDRTVDPANSARLAERIRVAGGEATVKTYSRLNHRTLIGAFSPALRFLGSVFNDTVAFVGQVAGDPRHLTMPSEAVAG